MVKVLRCNHCGNIITYLVDKGVPVVCCGEKMEELVPNTSDGAGEKHVPVIKIEGAKVCVEISTVEHPMMEKHWITLIAIETDKGVQHKELTPSDAPKADFALCEGEELKAVYEYCNLHGLWKAEL